MRRAPGFCLLLTLALAGCMAPQRRAGTGATSSDGRGRSNASADVPSVADRLVQSMVRHPAIAGGTRPVVEVNGVEDRTGASVRTKAMADRIRTALVKTRMVRFTPVSPTSRDALDRARREVPGQVVAPTDARKATAKRTAGGYLLYGVLDATADAHATGRYRLTLALINLDTGGIEWQDTQEVLPAVAGS